MTNADVTSQTGTADALAAAGIPVERQGRARVRRLSRPERQLYSWILRGFATADPPTAAATRTAATGFGADPTAALAALARDDLVHTDADGAPLVAYPFSAVARGHQVLIDGRHTVQAMCALDALGIAPMLNLPIEILSHDPVDGAEIRVELNPASGASWQPAKAVVLAGSACCEGPSFQGCCDVLNFFASRENATRYVAEHPQITGTAITIPEAIEAGRAIFAAVLDEH